MSKAYYTVIYNFLEGSDGWRDMAEYIEKIGKEPMLPTEEWKQEKIESRGTFAWLAEKESGWFIFIKQGEFHLEVEVNKDSSVNLKNFNEALSKEIISEMDEDPYEEEVYFHNGDLWRALRSCTIGEHLINEREEFSIVFRTMIEELEKWRLLGGEIAPNFNYYDFAEWIGNCRKS